MIDLNTATAKDTASYFSSKVNSFLFSPDALAEEQKGSRQMEDLDILWIKVLSDDNYRTDARNEASAETGRKLAKISFIKRKMELVNNEKMQEVAEKMSFDHRTLQQSFSGLIFCHLLQSCNKREYQILTETMGDSFYKLPLI